MKYLNCFDLNWLQVTEVNNKSACMEARPQKSFSCYGSVVSIRYFLIELCKISSAANCVGDFRFNWTECRGSVGLKVIEEGALNSKSSSCLPPTPRAGWH